MTRAKVLFLCVIFCLLNRVFPLPTESTGSGTRTRTGVTSQGILSPLRLPFRHAGMCGFRDTRESHGNTFRAVKGSTGFTQLSNRRTRSGVAPVPGGHGAKHGASHFCVRRLRGKPPNRGSHRWRQLYPILTFLNATPRRLPCSMVQAASASRICGDSPEPQEIK